MRTYATFLILRAVMHKVMTMYNCFVQDDRDEGEESKFLLSLVETNIIFKKDSELH